MNNFQPPGPGSDAQWIDPTFDRPETAPPSPQSDAQSGSSVGGTPLDSLPIGPNSCHQCGGDYGKHSDDCAYNNYKAGKMVPREVSMLDLILEKEELKNELFGLKVQLSASRAREADLREALAYIHDLAIQTGAPLGEAITKAKRALATGGENRE